MNNNKNINISWILKTKYNNINTAYHYENVQEETDRRQMSHLDNKNGLSYLR